ncbi:recombinase family protein [Rufibacter ruber]|uniref:recombinase family protein n=1 Tax=Rufibacter ruber TaxID=1783499 RepID=UPI0008352084|nr:recombinase family protein [Rufibacter ruber]
MKYIEYYRVSTEKQGRSGLGLEAQAAAVTAYIKSVGGESINRFVEVESGGSKDKISAHQDVTIEKLLKRRPILLQAINEAQATGATIIVKEASRLSRFSLLINYLIACNIRFLSADSPQDDEMFIRLRTAFNEEELKKVSERTKKALAARKARGYSLGKPENFSSEGRAKGAAKTSENAAKSETNRKVLNLVRLYKEKGWTLQQICDELNSLGYKTPRGKTFQTGSIAMLLKGDEKRNDERHYPIV